MKSINLLILGILFVVLTISLVSAEQNVLTNYTGNESTGLTAVLTTTQVTINPDIGDNVTYCTTVNLTILDNSYTTFNLTSFYFHLPDNATTTTVTDFYVTNSSSNIQINATEFMSSAYNYVNFTSLDGFFNDSTNGTQFNITWKLLAPIAQSKLAVTQAGRQYTETWNITSAASNMTIENASLTMVPTYWYTRVGTPTTVQFNTTDITYGANLSNIVVYTSLNHTEGTGNLLEYGSGWGELKIVYDGPTVDSSSGSSATTAAVSVLPLSERVNAKSIFIYTLIGISLIGAITLVVVLLKKV